MKVAFGLLIAILPLGQAPASKHDPKALAILDQCAAAIKALNAFHEKITINPSSETAGTLTAGAKKIVEVKFQKPNKLWINLDEAGAGRLRIISDGQMIWKWSSRTNIYSRSAAPKDIAEIVDLPDVTPDLAVLFGKIPDFKLWPGQDVQLRPAPAPKDGDKGLDFLEGEIRSPGVNVGAKMTVAINRTDHLIRSVTFASIGTDSPQTKAQGFKVEVTYDLVDPSPAVGPADFRFTPPRGAKLDAGAAPDKTKPDKR